MDPVYQAKSIKTNEFGALLNLGRVGDGNQYRYQGLNLIG